MLKYCPFCGGELFVRCEFCLHCGNPLPESVFNEPVNLLEAAEALLEQIAEEPEEPLPFDDDRTQYDGLEVGNEDGCTGDREFQRRKRVMARNADKKPEEDVEYDAGKFGSLEEDEFGFPIDHDQWQNRKEEKFDIFDESNPKRKPQHAYGEKYVREHVVKKGFIKRNLPAVLTVAAVIVAFAAFEAVMKM